jgi:hypothetical protein
MISKKIAEQFGEKWAGFLHNQMLIFEKKFHNNVFGGTLFFSRKIGKNDLWPVKVTTL